MVVGPRLGLPVECTIKEINRKNNSVYLTVNLSKSDTVERTHEAPIPMSWGGANGEFAGGYPIEGSTVLAIQGQGGKWYILTALPSNEVSIQDNNLLSNSSYYNNQLSSLREGRHVIQVQNNINQIMSPDFGIRTGNPDQYVHIDPDREMKSDSINLNLFLTEADRKITGPVFRETKQNARKNASTDALYSHNYQRYLSKIGLDTRVAVGNAAYRNPGYVENREITYEFEEEFGFTNDLDERKIYDGETVEQDGSFKRRQSRADSLSLSLIEPNQLIEQIKGTVVDIYGNLLDLNRTIIPSGRTVTFRDDESNPAETFTKLRELTRKSIGYHFELNARKAELPDLNNLDFFTDNNLDYSRQRSKFSFDIDKEGQFKLNVPSSSEVGNVALPVRYENYSTVSGSTNDTDPRAYVRNTDNQDIFVDSSSPEAGAVTLTAADEMLEGFGAPTDRITDKPVKLGTVFHNVADTMQLHAVEEPVPLYPASKLNDNATVPPITSLFSENINISGEDANAGGRSGTINLDGMLSMSIGANTIDRQSLWLDCQGGIVSNVGRDKDDISYAGKFDGDINIEIGGTTLSSDSRFADMNNAYKPGVLDIRVASGNAMHVVRIDGSGVRIYSLGEVDIVSEGDLKLESRKGDVYINGEGIYMYANDRDTARKVLRKPGRSIR